MGDRLWNFAINGLLIRMVVHLRHLDFHAHLLYDRGHNLLLSSLCEVVDGFFLNCKGLELQRLLGGRIQGVMVLVVLEPLCYVPVLVCLTVLEQ